MFGRGLRRLIGWALIFGGIALAFLSLVVLGTYPIGETFLSMTLKQWGVVFGCGAAMLIGFVMMVIGDGVMPHQLRASLLRTRHILLRRVIGVVFILTGIGLIMAVGMLFLIGSAGPIDRQLVFALVVMALFGLASIVFGLRRFRRLNTPTTG